MQALARWKCFKTQKVMPFKIFIMEHLSKSGAMVASSLNAIFQQSDSIFVFVLFRFFFRSMHIIHLAAMTP